MMIHSGGLSPGDRLPSERELCLTLEVSRSTLRDALQRLRAAGYTEVRLGGNGGTYVASLSGPYQRWLSSMRSDPKLLRGIIDVRTAVECEIVRLAALRRTIRQLDQLESTLVYEPDRLTSILFRESDALFHAGLADAADSPRLKALMLDGRGELFAPDSSLLINVPTMVRSIGEHRNIIDAIRGRNQTEAADAMRSHLESTFSDVLAAIEAMP